MAAARHTYGSEGVVQVVKSPSNDHDVVNVQPEGENGSGEADTCGAKMHEFISDIITSHASDYATSGVHKLIQHASYLSNVLASLFYLFVYLFMCTRFTGAAAPLLV